MITLIDRYEVDSKIGEGGMQYVFLAHDKILNRKVALKTPKNPSAQKRFKRSAIVAAKVNHPNVAKTYDYFIYDNKEYLVEEFIEGTDLDKAILGRYNHVDPLMTMHIFHNLSKALAASHHVGVIHRDLKPTNIMVTGDVNIEAIKVTDFGIAKMAEEEIDDAAKGGEESLTTSQTAIGALPYMAPEIINSPKDISKPTDVWAIGAMIYRVLTGNYPFGAGYLAIPNILSGIPKEYPKFVTQKTQFRDLSNEIIKIITKCFEMQPEKRPTADELVTLCGDLCYSVHKREIGVVNNILHKKYGFIDGLDGSKPVFFHTESVYGSNPDIADTVIYSKFTGGGSDRCHPVVLFKK